MCVCERAHVRWEVKENSMRESGRRQRKQGMSRVNSVQCILNQLNKYLLST